MHGATGWSSDPAGVTGTIEDLPFLPEARAALNAVVQRMRAGDPSGAGRDGLLAATDGIGLTAATGLVPDALNHLLHDAGAFAVQRLADAGGRTALATALAAFVPGRIADRRHGDDHERARPSRPST